jgi:hypothetical protein
MGQTASAPIPTISTRPEPMALSSLPLGRAAVVPLLPQAVVDQRSRQQYTLRQAQEVAARLRSESDVLRMAPRASKDDPDFVDTFYRSSRLHFIGTWRSRIEGLLGELDEVGPAPAQIKGALAAPPLGHFAVGGLKKATKTGEAHPSMHCASSPVIFQIGIT